MDTTGYPERELRPTGAGVRSSIPLTGLLLFLASLLTVLSAGGCGRGGTATDMTVETLVNGVVRVTHTALADRPLAADTLASWDLWAEDADHYFNAIAGIAGSGNGFFICDRGNREVVAVDLTGRVVSTFGRDGEGPGEFRFPNAIGAVGGELWIADIMNRRFSVYSTGGEHVADVRWGSLAWQNFLPRTDGTLLMDIRTRLNFENLDDGLEPRYDLVILDPESGEVDTLTSMPGLPEQQIEIRASTGQGMTFIGPPQFAPRLQWWFSGAAGRLVAVTGEAYRIEVRDADGRLLTEILAPSPDLTVTQRDREWFFNERGLRFGFGSGETFQASRESLEDYPFAERRQAVEGIRIDPLGRIWVQAATADPGVHRLDLFSTDGVYLGHLGPMPLPLAFTDDGDALIRVEDEENADRYFVITVASGGSSERK